MCVRVSERALARVQRRPRAALSKETGPSRGVCPKHPRRLLLFIRILARWLRAEADSRFSLLRSPVSESSGRTDPRSPAELPLPPQHTRSPQPFLAAFLYSLPIPHCDTFRSLNRLIGSALNEVSGEVRVFARWVCITRMRERCWLHQCTPDARFSELRRGSGCGDLQEV